LRFRDQASRSSAARGRNPLRASRESNEWRSLCPENIRKLKASEIGYFGKGVPDPEVMSELQEAYCSNLLKNRYVAPEVRAELKHMQLLQAEAVAKSGAEGENLRLQASTLAVELAEILHFRVDDIEWDFE
jgi:hypothetical protein